MTADARHSAAVEHVAAGAPQSGDAELLLELFATASERARSAERELRSEREAMFALAVLIADVLDGRPINPSQLPAHARRVVIAYRHQSGRLAGVPATDQFGALPVVPPRASVMRDEYRIVDLDVEPDPRIVDIPVDLTSD